MRSSPLGPVWLVSLALLSGCATHTPLACPQAPARSVRSERVLFATDREQDTSPRRNGTEGALDFGPGRTNPAVLQLGWENVQIRQSHRQGVIDPAVSLADGQIIAGAPGQTLGQSDREISHSVSAAVRTAIRSSPAPNPGERRQVLLFIHGYNDTFRFAVLKTGQLAADLDLLSCQGERRGVPIAYSWPAQGKFLSYLADEENAEWTQQRFVPFLRALADVTREEGADLCIIAHSMGARLLVRSLAEMANRGERRQLFSQIILLAPDLARDLFNQYAERALPIVGHISVYANAKDRALALSTFVHGGHGRLGLIQSAIALPTKLLETAIETPTKLLQSAVDAPGRLMEANENQSQTGRAPNAAEQPRALAAAAARSPAGGKVDVIDVTGGITDFTGHSYEDPAFIADLKEVIHHHRPAAARQHLVHVNNPGPSGLEGPRLSYYRLETSR